MAVNKVVINDEVVLDLTGDTVQAADLPKGGNRPQCHRGQSHRNHKLCRFQQRRRLRNERRKTK
jgi:hypothetical protein